jgi:hypothetical protein
VKQLKFNNVFSGLKILTSASGVDADGTFITGKVVQSP